MSQGLEGRAKEPKPSVHSAHNTIWGGGGVICHLLNTTIGILVLPTKKQESWKTFLGLSKPFQRRQKLGCYLTIAALVWISPFELFINATCFSPLSKFTHFFTFVAPKVCEACKNKNEDDNDIMETLCKNDFGK